MNSTSSAQPLSTPPKVNLREIYTAYVEAIRPRQYDSESSSNFDSQLQILNTFVSSNVIHNDIPLGLEQYKDLIDRNILTPRSSIDLEMLLVDDSQNSVCARLVFRVPKDTRNYLGFNLNEDHQVEVVEHVIYRFDEQGRIERVWSVVDLDPVRKWAI